MSIQTARVADETAKRFVTTVGKLLHGGRAPAYSKPRQVMCWVLISLGYGYAMTGRELDLHHTTVMHAVRVVSERPELVAAGMDILAEVIRAEGEIT